MVRGDFELLSGMGLTVDPGRGTVALCRCGGSMIKPFCDGTHKLLAFDAPDPAEHAALTDDDHPTSPIKENTLMNDAQENLTPTNDTPGRDVSKDEAKDHVSDPALNTEPGHDWTDEGGATPDGPALEAESSDGSGS
ncbi:CDGSH iron-sulfur domain-containing protein [Paeniglutamicibacter sp.]|uniref:CDGSH iron-sulfur domain-containing protein n=1 Tax=Paeniglutamicibacter sp. TaxID=1934391 RepID=UPI00398946A5